MSEAFSIGLDTKLITTPHYKNKTILQNKSAFKLLPYGTKHNKKETIRKDNQTGSHYSFIMGEHV